MAGYTGTRKTDWYLVIAGILLVLFGIAAYSAPWLFLEFLTVWAGIGFLISGIAGAVSYFQLRKYGASGWNLAMAIIDIIVGIMLIMHPFVFADLIPWMLGVAFIVVGVMEATGCLPFVNMVPASRAITVASGVLSVIVGVMFIMQPASFAIWVAVFALIRGITLVVIGFTSRV